MNMNKLRKSQVRDSNNCKNLSQDEDKEEDAGHKDSVRK